MSFSENMQYLRKKENMTQEQLAEGLEVSRQAVSKWESGQSYPEMDKMLQICELFHCSLDDLVQGDITIAEKEDLNGYDRQMNSYSLFTASSIAMMIASVGLMVILSQLLQGIVPEDIVTIGMIVMIGIAVSILIVTHINQMYFQKRYPVIQDFYTEEDHYHFSRKFAAAIAWGVSMILLGTCLNIGLEHLGNETIQECGGGILLFCVAAAVWIFVYFGLQKKKYEVEEYNRANLGEKGKGEKLVEKISGVVMLLATAIFLYLGIVEDMFRIAWVVYPIGGILCAAASVIWKDNK